MEVYIMKIYYKRETFSLVLSGMCLRTGCNNVIISYVDYLRLTLNHSFVILNFFVVVLP